MSNSSLVDRTMRLLPVVAIVLSILSLLVSYFNYTAQQEQYERSLGVTWRTQAVGTTNDVSFADVSGNVIPIQIIVRFPEELGGSVVELRRSGMVLHFDSYSEEIFKFLFRDTPESTRRIVQGFFPVLVTSRYSIQNVEREDVSVYSIQFEGNQSPILQAANVSIFPGGIWTRIDDDEQAESVLEAMWSYSVDNLVRLDLNTQTFGGSDLPPSGNS